MGTSLCVFRLAGFCSSLDEKQRYDERRAGGEVWCEEAAVKNLNYCCFELLSTFDCARCKEEENKWGKNEGGKNIIMISEGVREPGEYDQEEMAEWELRRKQHRVHVFMEIGKNYSRNFNFAKVANKILQHREWKFFLAAWNSTIARCKFMSHIITVIQFEKSDLREVNDFMEP